MQNVKGGKVLQLNFIQLMFSTNILTVYSGCNLN